MAAFPNTVHHRYHHNIASLHTTYSSGITMEMDTASPVGVVNPGAKPAPGLAPRPAAPAASDYTDAFVTLSPSSRSLLIRHPGIPFLGSRHVIPLHQIQFLKSAGDLDLLSAEYRVWGPGPSWIWWAWDLRRAGLLKKTERERCMVAKVQIAWITFWIGFTVEDRDEFMSVLEASDWVQLGMA
jgi:hypothetical protein